MPRCVLVLEIRLTRALLLAYGSKYRTAFHSCRFPDDMPLTLENLPFTVSSIPCGSSDLCFGRDGDGNACLPQGGGRRAQPHGGIDGYPPGSLVVSWFLDVIVSWISVLWLHRSLDMNEMAGERRGSHSVASPRRFKFPSTLPSRRVVQYGNVISIGRL